MSIPCWLYELEHYFCPRQVCRIIRISTVRTSGHTMMQKFYRLFIYIYIFVHPTIALGRLYCQEYLQFHQSSPYVYLVFSFPSLVCTNKHRCCLVYRVNFQLMCPLATGIGTVHIKFEDVNICIWYSCVLIINTQFNSSVACGLA
jgi:hypothetical protein